MKKKKAIKLIHTFQKKISDKLSLNKNKIEKKN